MSSELGSSRRPSAFLPGMGTTTPESWTSRNERGSQAERSISTSRTKTTFLVTLFREKIAEFVESVGKAVAEEPDAIAKIRRLVRMHFEVFESNIDLAEVVQVELRQGQKFFRGASAREVTSYFTLIGSALTEGIDHDLFRKDLPVKVATKVLFGALDQMTTSWVLGARGYKLSEATEVVADIFLNGIKREGEVR